MAKLHRPLLAPARLNISTMLTAVAEAEFAVLRDNPSVSDSGTLSTGSARLRASV